MASPECKLLAFKVPIKGVAYTGEINHLYNSVTLTLPANTPLESNTVIILASAGATVTPKNGSRVSLKEPLTIKIVAENEETTATYTVKTVYEEEKKTVQKEQVFRHMGWTNIRCITGNLGAYRAGGIKLNLRSFLPRTVIGIQVDKGHIGYYDLDTQKLKVYKSAGVEASADEYVKFSVVLMGE